MRHFEEIKEEILKRAKNAGACTGEYKRAYKAENFKELLSVVTDNFSFSCANRIIDIGLLAEIGKDICEQNNLFFNVDSSKGYLLVDNATVRASGNATVEASGNATVRAYDNATVRAWGNATVEAWGNATVEASGNVTVEAWDNATVRASGNATVEAWGNVYINSYNSIEHKISDRAILRYNYQNKVVLAEDIDEVKTIK